MLKGSTLHRVEKFDTIQFDIVLQILVLLLLQENKEIKKNI
jgi:hypothetical protein